MQDDISSWEIPLWLTTVGHNNLTISWPINITLLSISDAAARGGQAAVAEDFGIIAAANGPVFDCYVGMGPAGEQAKTGF